MTETRTQLSRPRRVVYTSIVVLLSIIMGVALAELGLTFYVRHVQSGEQMDMGLLVYDAQLGWRMASNWTGRHRHYDFDVKYTTNTRGLRGSWPDSPPGMPRHAFLGDSFTFALGANDDETFVQRLNEAVPATVHLNAGIAGYSTDQQFLFLKDRLAGWRVERLSLVVYLANDLLDNTLRYPLQAEMGKPLFQLDSTGLSLTNVPVPLEPKSAQERNRTMTTMVLGEAGAQALQDSWRSRWQWARILGWNESASPELLEGMSQRLKDPSDLFARLVEEMRRLCEQNQVALDLVLMPGRSYVEAPDSLSAAFQDTLRAEILSRQQQLRVPIVDLATQLREGYRANGERLFHPNEGHLNVLGHRAVARLLQQSKN